MTAARAGDYVSHEGRMCRVLAVTFRDGGIYKLARSDGSVIEDVKLNPTPRPRLVKGEW